MAEKKEELDLDVQPKSGGKKMLILIVVIVLLVLALGGVTAMLLLKDKGPAAGTAGQAAGEEQAAAVKEEVHYLALDRLVVNFGQGGPARFLQVDLQLMSHDPAALEAVTAHMPMVRNDILLLLGGQKYEEVSTIEGKQKLQTAILEAVQRILDAQAGGKRVDAVYFTEFVMQ